MKNDPLLWRYATKKFDPAKKIPGPQLEQLLDALWLSPSSFGLQPWKFVLVKDPALRRQLKGHAWNQDQVVDASHLIVLCSLNKMSEEHIRFFVTRMAQERKMDRNALAGYEEMMLGWYKSKTPAELSLWMKRQVYIALGFLMYAAAVQGIDTCPMEGFDPAAFDRILGLDKDGLESVVLCPVGYRAQDDAYASLAKVRNVKSDIFSEK